jgi:hypothetical protein
MGTVILQKPGARYEVMARRHARVARLASAALALLTAAWLWAAYRTSDDRLPPGAYEPRSEPHWHVAETEAKAIRDDALARAAVWRPPAVPIESADLSGNPGDPDPFDPARVLACKFLPRPSSGTTPKFDCVLPDGEVVKVKYGGTPEPHAEVAGARLLSALGFGADRMYLLPRVRCFGCPYSPFRTYQVLELARMEGAYTSRIDYDHYVDFRWVSVERRFRASSIDAPGVKGWGFFELDRVDPARGGAPRAHVDALRLAAVLLHHWDNKAENQRLVCLDEPEGDRNRECPRPFILLQDLGSTFGPNKVHYESWSTRPVFAGAGCDVHMEDMPFGGATFGRATIGEAGRRFLSERLDRLSDEQLRDLFAGARFPEHHGRRGPGASAEDWARALRGKAAEIAGRSCPGPR